MANMYDISAGIQQPNIVGNFNQGVQTAQQNQVFGEKQQAYQQALAQQQNINALAPKIIAGDPAATEQAQAIDPAAAAQYAPAAAQHLQRISGAIRYIDQQSTPQAKEAAYQNVRPYLAQFGQEPPATFAEAEPKMEQARAQIAALQGTQKPGFINVAAGGALVDPVTGKPVFQNQGVPKTPPIVSVNMPDGSTQQYQHNPDGTLSRFAWLRRERHRASLTCSSRPTRVRQAWPQIRRRRLFLAGPIPGLRRRARWPCIPAPRLPMIRPARRSRTCRTEVRRSVRTVAPRQRQLASAHPIRVNLGAVRRKICRSRK